MRVRLVGMEQDLGTDQNRRILARSRRQNAGLAQERMSCMYNTQRLP